jgi:hemerythrin-like domain-containing protein
MTFRRSRDRAMTTTGEQPRAERDLVEVLLDAHVRGHALLASALGMLQSDTDELIAADIAASVHRFLTFTNPQHELDEEQMIFPALRAAGCNEVRPALAQLVEAHMVFDARREELAKKWERVTREPACLHDEHERAELFEATQRLAEALERHRQHEDLEILPLIRKYVAAETQARILAVLSRREARP